MEKKVEVKIVAQYNGHKVNANQSVDISFKSGYDQLTSYIQLIQFLNVDTTIQAKIPDEKPFSLGTFRIREVKVDHDGEGQLRFNSMADYVETDNFNRLIGSELVNLRFTAMVELETETDEEDSEE
jgi:hypothetical protein